jgi:hypothetical protein
VWNVPNLLVAHAGITTNLGNVVATILAAPAAGSRYRVWGWSACYDAVGAAYNECRMQLFAGSSPPASGSMYGQARITSTLQGDQDEQYPGGLVSATPANAIRVRHISTAAGDSVVLVVYYSIEQA